MSIRIACSAWLIHCVDGANPVGTASLELSVLQGLKLLVSPSVIWDPVAPRRPPSSPLILRIVLTVQITFHVINVWTIILVSGSLKKPTARGEEGKAAFLVYEK